MYIYGPVVLRKCNDGGQLDICEQTEPDTEWIINKSLIISRNRYFKNISNVFLHTKQMFLKEC